MFILIKNSSIYSPKFIGEKDILICNDKIVEIGDNLNYTFKNLITIDGKGKKCVPGFMDTHMHIIGGGGEAGCITRVPEIPLSTFITSGLTTVTGLLGTDSITRNIETLVAKTKSLNESGMNAYCLTGSYTFPSPTLTGDLQKDIVYINEIVGVKLAMSDHRSSAITFDELERLALNTRVAGMVAGKKTFVEVHIGTAKSYIEMILKVVEKGQTPASAFKPTHISRSKDLFKQGIQFNKMGGYIDITSCLASHLPMDESFAMLKEEKALLDRVTLSSDGNGSWNRVDSDGKIIEIGKSSCNEVHNGIKFLVENKILSLEEALPFATSNTAGGLGIENERGSIKENYYADLLLLDDKLEIDTVIANGNIMMQNREVLVKGYYE